MVESLAKTLLFLNSDVDFLTVFEGSEIAVRIREMSPVFTPPSARITTSFIPLFETFLHVIFYLLSLFFSIA